MSTKDDFSEIKSWLFDIAKPIENGLFIAVHGSRAFNGFAVKASIVLKMDGNSSEGSSLINFGTHTIFVTVRDGYIESKINNSIAGYKEGLNRHWVPAVPDNPWRSDAKRYSNIIGDVIDKLQNGVR